MKNIYALLLISMSLSSFSYGQCTIMSNATAGPTLSCTGGTTYRSGVAYNPNFDILYSVNSGSSSYQMETFDPTGTPLATISQGHDFRGLWWNPNLDQLEGNGYGSTGIFVENLNGTNGYPLGNGTVVIPGQNQPAAHSCGQYDDLNNEIIYYNSGGIQRYDRTSGTFIGTTTITGLPVATSNLNSTSIGYTGCAGMEVVVYDYVNQRVYFINLSTGAYVATSQLPGSAPVPSAQRMSYAMDLFWVFNEGTLTWHSYQITDPSCESSSFNTISACDSYDSPSGNYNWTSSGIYMDTIMNSSGCDSVMTIDLTVNSVDNNVTQNDVLLTADATGATYQWLDCDANYSVINGEINQFFNAGITGNYAVEITAGGCVDTSACYLVDYSSIDELNFNDKELIKIYDVLGRETIFQPNTPLIYLYSDGTIRRVFTLED